MGRVPEFGFDIEKVIGGKGSMSVDGSIYPGFWSVSIHSNVTEIFRYVSIRRPSHGKLDFELNDAAIASGKTELIRPAVGIIACLAARALPRPSGIVYIESTKGRDTGFSRDVAAGLQAVGMSPVDIEYNLPPLAYTATAGEILQKVGSYPKEVVLPQ